MSLMRFLSAGKSLIGVTESTSQYRMGKPGMMPKFGSGKNPFLSGVKQAEGQGGVAARPPSPTAASPNEVKEYRAATSTMSGEKSPGPVHTPATLPKSPPNGPAVIRPKSDESAERPRPERSEVKGDAKASARPVLRPGASRATRLMPGGPVALRAMFGNWLDEIKAHIPGSRTAQARIATARSAIAPLQGELSLDRVKVVRNDLSDTDFEIASREPSPPRREADARANNLKTALKAELTAGVDTGCARRPSGRLDDLRPPERAGNGQIPASERGAAGAMFRPVGAGWFASVQR